jgi:hypothetical protein
VCHEGDKFPEISEDAETIPYEELGPSWIVGLLSYLDNLGCLADRTMFLWLHQVRIRQRRAHSSHDLVPPCLCMYTTTVVLSEAN